MKRLWQYYSRMQSRALRKSEGWYYLLSSILQIEIDFFFYLFTLATVRVKESIVEIQKD